MTTPTTRAPVPGRRLLAALGLWIGTAGAVGAATALTAQAIVPRWASPANLSVRKVVIRLRTSFWVVLRVASRRHQRAQAKVAR